MRLIDADALHGELKAKQKWVVRRGGKHNEGYLYDDVHFAIDDAPTVDAVPVIRCKDCRNYVIRELKQNGDYDYRYRPSYCLYNDQYTKPTDFCSWAERKE